MENRGVKRKAVSLETKFEILGKVKQGEKKINVTTSYGISPSTVTGILKKDQEIREAYEKQCKTIYKMLKLHCDS